MLFARQLPNSKKGESYEKKEFGNDTSTIFLGEYEITTDGAIREYNGKATEIEIPEVITTTINGERQEISITSIGSTAFWGADEAVSITIPASVSSISGGTFQRCDNSTKSTALTAKVKKIKGVDGYQFVIATDKNFPRNLS